MKTVTLTVNFSGTDFFITGNDDRFDVNDLRRQVVDFNEKNPETQICGTVRSRDMNGWVRSLSDTAKAFYEFEAIRGGNNRGATYVKEVGVYAYSAWLNEEFGFAVMTAFKHLVNDEVEEAVKVVRKVTRTPIRQDNVDYTNYFASRVNRQFGNALVASVMKTIQNHINRSLFGVETEELREMARNHTGSKAKKIAHRELYDDATIIRITSVTSSCILKFEELYGQALSPKELLNEMLSFIDNHTKLCGGAKIPTYKDVK